MKTLRARVHKFNVFIIAVIVVKIILSGFFSSDYQNKMFMPFVAQFLNTHENPYSYYYTNELISSFPYPPLMLIIESIGGILVKLLADAPVFFINILFKLPSLFFDCVGLYYLILICNDKRKYVAVLYFASPIILYAVYMHGQLDIIPTSLLIGAIYYITSNKKYSQLWYLLFMTAALSTKLHILALMPLLFFYIYKKKDFGRGFLLTVIPLAASAFIMLPFWGEGFVQTVLFNPEQNVLTEVFLNYKNIKIYLPILAVLLLYLNAFRIDKINKDLMISFCGVLFAVFLALIPPMPAWFVWIVPFIMIFFAGVRENKSKMLTLYAGFNVLYAVYFLFFHNAGFTDLYFLNHSLQALKQNFDPLRNILFTGLAAFLIAIIWGMYQFGITSNAFYRRRNLPFTIGIAGDSGSGKSYLLSLVEKLLGSRSILCIEGDGDHRWERNDESWKSMTQLNPRANYLYRQAKDIETLRTGAYVKRVEYDHSTGKFTEAKKIKPKSYIILSGLHSFYLPLMRRQLDLKIYMDPEENLRRFWKIERDTSTRGYSTDKILSQIEQRMPDAQKYIYPQKIGRAHV
jgi:uridine kinase